MGCGIYREQPNAIAINQGLECQLYQYLLFTDMSARRKKPARSSKHGRAFLPFREDHYGHGARGLSLTSAQYLRLKVGRAHKEME